MTGATAGPVRGMDNDWRRSATSRHLDERQHRIGQLLTREKDWMTYM